jgi:hypothetical protein
MAEGTLYPDVLGVITHERLTLYEALHAAIGIFPASTVLDQPVEALLLLQNLLDQPLRLQLSLRSPTHDPKGNLINIFTPKPRLSIVLPGGDCGLLHIPLIPQLPTPPGEHYRVGVHITLEKPDIFHQVRSLGSGSPPNLLSISPVRLSVLREIEFKAQTSSEAQLCATFNLLPGHLPPRAEVPVTRYEALWTVRDLQHEQEQMKAVAAEALRFAKSLDRGLIFGPLFTRTKDIFGDAGIPLHPGETMFITKALTYVMEDGLELEQGFSLAEGYWFRRLCGLMIREPDVIKNPDRLLNLLYTAVVQDAVMLGFSMVGHDTRVDFGDLDERTAYMSKVTAALEGRVPLALEYLYVPLILAGVILNARMIVARENPWHSLEALVEARNGRIRLAGLGLREVFDILDGLIERSERLLWEMRVPKD